MTNLKPTPWIFGLGANLVDDDGNPVKIVLGGRSVNVVPYPSTLMAEKYMDKGWSVAFNFSYNHFKTGKLINNDIPFTVTSDFLAFDLLAKYNFCELFDFNKIVFHSERKILDIYAASGFGYTIRNTARVKDAMTFNLGPGSNIWFTDRWGMNLQAMAKFGLKAPLFKTPYNYLQYCLGIIYRFKPGGGV